MDLENLMYRSKKGQSMSKEEMAFCEAELKRDPDNYSKLQKDVHEQIREEIDPSYRRQTHDK